MFKPNDRNPAPRFSFFEACLISQNMTRLCNKQRGKLQLVFLSTGVDFSSFAVKYPSRIVESEGSECQTLGEHPKTSLVQMTVFEDVVYVTTKMKILGRFSKGG
ncbi:unnamed protein product [Umbelopsis ramanniana]